jgi:hypothetical protein
MTRNGSAGTLQVFWQWIPTKTFDFAKLDTMKGTYYLLHTLPPPPHRKTQNPQLRSQLPQIKKTKQQQKTASKKSGRVGLRGPSHVILFKHMSENPALLAYKGPPLWCQTQSPRLSFVLSLSLSLSLYLSLSIFRFWLCRDELLWESQFSFRQTLIN